MAKIYTDDSRVKYVVTTVSPERTKEEIDAKLREYGIGDIGWHYFPDKPSEPIFVTFGIEEIINGVKVKVAARVTCPAIWNKAVPRSPNPERRVESLNLKVSMRTMFWYIKAHLETAYAMQSSRVAGFLPDIVTNSGRTYFDSVLGRIHEFAALPEEVQEKPREIEVIATKPRNVTNE